MKKDIKSEAAILRQKAEELLKKKPLIKDLNPSEAETLRLIQELSVYQIELEMQNEELVRAKEQARDDAQKYTELYDFAPAGYFTLSKAGKIIELNLCGSQMLGKVRTLLKNSLFGFFVSDDTKPVFNNFLGKVFNSKTKETCEVTLSTRGNSPKYVSLTGIVTEKGEQCLLTATDITEHKLAVETVRESEILLNTLVQAIPELIWLKNPDGVFLSCNAMFERLIGASRAEIIGKTDYDFVDRDLADSFHDNDRKTIAAGKPTHNEEWNTFKDDGHHALLETIKTPMYDSGGKLIGVLGIAHEITERRQEEIAIQLSEKKYRFIVENVGEGIGFVNADEEFVVTNPAAEKIFGVGKGELLGKNLKEFLSEEQYMWILAQTKNRKDGQNSNYEFELTRLDGKKRNIIITAVPQFDDNKKFIGTHGIFRDITERKLAEEELVNQKKFFEQTFTQSSVSTQIFDKEGWCERINPKLSQIFGVQPEHIEGRVYNIFKDEAIKQGGVIPLLEKVFNEGKTAEWDIYFDIGVAAESQNIEVEEKRKVWYHNWAYPIFDENDKLSHVIIQHNDISDRKQAEEEIRLKNEELQKSNAEKDKFFSIIAHDLRGPLGTFMDLTEMMADDSQDFTPDQKKDLTSTLSHSARNVFNLLENLLEWSQMQRGSTAFNPQILGLKEVVTECLITAVESARGKAIEIALDIPGGQKVFADINMLKSVIHNLVSNGVKFTPQGGKVTISAGPGENNTAIIAVKDTGIGISHEMLDNLFRIDRKNSRLGTKGEPSIGLGLLLCKEFIEKHGGRIWVESEERIGSTFYFRMPADQQRNI